MLISLSAFATEKCKGTKANGEKCQGVILMKNGYCKAHDPNAKHCPKIKKDGKQCKMVTDGTMCRFHK